MASSRIKSPKLAPMVEEGQLAWHRHITPITQHYCRQISQRDYRGKRLASWGHILFDKIPWLLAIKAAGAEVAVGACNVDSTDDAVAAYLDSKGVLVYGWRGMTQAEYRENLALIRDFDADYLCDMGGELSEVYLDKIPPVIGALEATTSGLNRLRELQLPFPVFDWNSIPLKDHLENRFDVGDSLWPAYNYVTGMGLFGKRVLVIGFGPVGKGIAERARNLGAFVHVADLDPVRLIEASHRGCVPVSLEDGLARCQVIVTATGVEGVLREAQLRKVSPGAILLNAGHSNREIDIDWLYQQPYQRMKSYIEHFDLGKTDLYLLAKGSLLNLAASPGPHGVDTFDHFTAIMLIGTAWMFDGLPPDIQPGLQRYPPHLEREIAELSNRLHHQI